MRLLCVTKSTGGLAVYNRRLCAGLRDRGYEVEVIALSEGGEEYAEALSAIGIQATAWPMDRYRIAPLRDIRLGHRMVRHVRRAPPDVIVGHGAKGGFLARFAGRATGTPTVYAMHSEPYLARVQGQAAPVYALAERAAARWFGGTTMVLSDAMRTRVIENRIAPAERVTVIRTGIATTQARAHDRAAARRSLGFEPGGLLVGWAGRFSRQKAPERFVAIAAELASRHAEVQFAMAGDGPQAAEIDRRIASHTPPGRLRRLAWQRDPWLLYAAADVFVLTSRWEGLPLVLLEAMAARCAIVAPRVDAIPEAVRDRVDGLLYPPQSPEACAAAVEALLTDDAMRERLTASAAQRIEREFTEHRMLAEWDALLRTTADAPGRGRVSGQVEPRE